MISTQSLEKNISPDSNIKVPKWLQGSMGSGRGELPIDSVEEDGDARDTARRRPSLRYKTAKQIKKKIAEAEELHEWIRKKGQKELETGETKVDDFIDGLERALNSMTE